MAAQFGGGKMSTKDIPRLVLSFRGPEPDSEVLQWIADGLAAGVVLFADNFISFSQLSRSVAVLKANGATQIMIDEEGGRVRRLPPEISPMKDIAEYGRQKDTAGAAADYAAVSETLVQIGMTTLLAPVADLQTAENRWLTGRAFSADPVAVSEFLRATIPAIQQTGLTACVKHFPGLGSVRNDLHQQQVIVTASASTLSERDLAPFRTAVECKVGAVMVSHAFYPALDSARPAVFSPLIIEGILKKQLGFSGLVLSDDLAMRAIQNSLPIEKAIELSLEAGCDLILVCNDRPLQRRAADFLAGVSAGR